VELISSAYPLTRYSASASVRHSPPEFVRALSGEEIGRLCARQENRVAAAAIDAKERIVVLEE